MRFDYTQIHEGMTVYSSDGEKLGKVHRCDSSMFVIEKGFFFPKDYIARYDDVRNIDDDGIHLTMSKDAFQDLREGAKGDEGWRAGPITTEGKPATTTADTIGADYGLGAAGVGQPGMPGDLSTSARAAQDTTGDLSRSARRDATGEEVRVPVAEEELDVTKRDREAGEVRLRKDVVTETKHVDVPVTREEVHVDRVPTSNRDATGEGKLFQKDTVSVPVHEEEIEITKRPVVKEEVRLRKDRIVEQRAADEDIKKERVDVDETGTGTKRSITDPDDEFSGS